MGTKFSLLGLLALSATAHARNLQIQEVYSASNTNLHAPNDKDALVVKAYDLDTDSVFWYIKPNGGGDLVQMQNPFYVHSGPDSASQHVQGEIPLAQGEPAQVGFFKVDNQITLSANQSPKGQDSDRVDFARLLPKDEVAFAHDHALPEGNAIRYSVGSGFEANGEKYFARGMMGDLNNAIGSSIVHLNAKTGKFEPTEYTLDINPIDSGFQFRNGDKVVDLKKAGYSEIPRSAAFLAQHVPTIHKNNLNFESRGQPKIQPKFYVRLGDRTIFYVAKNPGVPNSMFDTYELKGGKVISSQVSGQYYSYLTTHIPPNGQTLKFDADNKNAIKVLNGPKGVSVHFPYDRNFRAVANDLRAIEAASAEAANAPKAPSQQVFPPDPEIKDKPIDSAE